MATTSFESGSSPVTLDNLKGSKTSKSSLFGTVMTALSSLFMAIVLLPLFAVLIYVTIKGASRFNLSLFTELPPAAGLSGGGIANAIVGTIVLLANASAISVPIGIMAAVYLSEFSNRRAAQSIRFATNVLNGVPSIIAGIFAYAMLVVTTGSFSAVAGGVALAVLMLPTIIRTTDESLQLVPQEVRWASVGLGASEYETVLKVVLPAAVSAILTGVVLALARAAGETAPLIFTALFSFFWVQGLFQPTPSLAVLVYNFAIVPFESQQELAWAASLILVLLVLITSVFARFVTRQRY